MIALPFSRFARGAAGIVVGLALFGSAAGFRHVDVAAPAAWPVAELPHAAFARTLPGPEAPPPAALQGAIDALGASFDGRVGIAVHEVGGNWTARFGSGRFPQQSVSKLWVAITLLDAVDRGQVGLDDPIVVGRGDLTVFHQPIRAEIGDAGYATSIGGLMTRALTASDNTANDVLLRRVGGPAAVRDMLSAKLLPGIAFGPGEKALQAGIAGMAWQPAFAVPGQFQEARAALSREVREQALDAYVAAPVDGATPDGIVGALAALARGELLSPEATRLLIATMAASHTGSRRLRAGLAPGWTLAHKTGTGQELGRLATGFNDVGLMTAPSGRTYAVAVMIAATRRGMQSRQEMIAEVARAVVAHEESRESGSRHIAGADAVLGS